MAYRDWKTKRERVPWGFICLLALLVSPYCVDSFFTSSPRSTSQHRRHSYTQVLAPTSPLYASSTTTIASEDSSAASALKHVRQSSSGAVAPLDRRITAFGRQGQTDAALELFYSIPSPTIRQVNAAIDACGRARGVRLEEAFRLLREHCDCSGGTRTANDVTQPQRLPRPNVYTFGALMSVCTRARNVDRALGLFETMAACGVVPNGVVYNAAIAACAGAARPDLARGMLQRAAQQNVTVGVVGHNAALAAAARAGEWQSALDLLRHMQQLGPAPDAVTHGTVLSACEKGGQWRLVMEQAEEMQHRGFSWDGLAISSVLHACQQLGLWKEALEYLRLMKTADSYERKTAGQEIAGNKQPLEGPDAVAYRLAISACAKGGAWREGIKLLGEYCELFDGGDAVAYTSAILGCRYEGQWQQAFLLLDRMRQSGIEPNEVTFAAIIYACASASAREIASESTSRTGVGNDNASAAKPKSHIKAMKLFNVLKNDPSVVNPNIQIYNAAIRSCAEALDIDRAFTLYEEMHEDGVSPTMMTYGELMTACERIGSKEMADQVFKIMREDGMEPNEIIYGAAISCCRKASDPERALSLLKKMIRESLKPNVAVFNTVLLAQAEAKGEPEQTRERAMTVYKILKSPEYPAVSPNRQTYNVLIRTLAANGDPRQAEAVLREMQRDGGFLPDVDLYTATVSAYERKGQPLRALRLMEAMRADGYDFYEFPVLNAAFKKAVSLVNAVGRLSSKSDDD